MTGAEDEAVVVVMQETLYSDSAVILRCREYWSRARQRLLIVITER